MPPFSVTAEDALGAPVSTFIGAITIAINTGPGGATLSGTTTVSALAGVASFSGISLDKAGTYTLIATSTGLASGISMPFSISAGAASKLAFTIQPTNTTAGSIINSPTGVQVTIEDSFGNAAFGSGTITVAIGTNPGVPPGTLSGTTSIFALTGVATFTTLSIDKTGAGYTLTATCTGCFPLVTGATSAAFNITAGPATKLGFLVQPTNTSGGAIISPAVQVAVQDSLSNTVTTATNSVTLAIGANPGGGTLSGTTTVAASSGVATFSNLSINKAGTGYTLTASSSPLTGATSASFNITVGPAAKLAFTGQPSNTTAGAAIAPPVQVTIQDAGGNTVTSASNSITVAIGTNPGGGTLSGTTMVAAFAGVASFDPLSINKSGTGYTLTASSGVLTGATSTAFNINPGAASQLAFTVQPTNTTAGSLISPAVQVTVQDSFANTVTGSSASVTVAIGSNPGGGTLSGTTTVVASSGVASFSTLSINKSGTGYTLTVSSVGLTGATSAAFNIAAATASQLVFSVQPTTTTAGASISPAVQVTVQDSFGNTVTTAGNSVTLAIGSNPGGGTLSGTNPVSASGGIATFSNLSINKAGTGYTLTASATGLTGATSASFNINPGAASQLVFTAQPSNTIAGTSITPAVQVTVQDVFANTVTSSTASITVAIGSNPGGGTLSGTTTIFASGGVATFSTLSINKSGTGYTLVASSSGLTGATSAAFNITAAAASQLIFNVQPTTTTAGSPISPAVQVLVQDAFGNTVTTASTSVTMTIGANPGGGTLSGTNPVSASSGVATFSNLSINKRGTGYTLVASAAGLTSTTSAAFNILAADLTLLKAHTGSFTGGSSGTYTLTVNNIGTAASSGVITVTDVLPAGFAFVSGTGGGWSCSAAGPTVTCTNLGPIAAGGSSSFSLIVLVSTTAGGVISNTATVSNPSDNDLTNNSATDATTVNRLAQAATYAFSPVSKVITVTNADVGGVSFVGTLVSVVSGTITTPAGAPIAGITVNICAGAAPCGTPSFTATTNAAGLFQVPAVPNGSYNVSASVPTTPASRNITVSSADVAGVNFTSP